MSATVTEIRVPIEYKVRFYYEGQVGGLVQPK